MKKTLLIVLCSVLGLFIALESAGYYIAMSADVNRANYSTDISDSKSSSKVLAKKLGSYSPKGTYLVVDTAKNILYMKNGDNIIKQAVVSSGSGNMLSDPSGNRQWVFDTPRGEYSVKSKLLNPEWIKPDWAFIEEGEDIPRKFQDRVEEGVLGDYALGFGNGYFIHGTLYTRMLGRNVTHGCIRVGDEDLKEIFRAAGIGTKIYIF